MTSLSDYGLLKFRASAIYFVIIQGFGYLMGLSYSPIQLFGLTTLGVALFNLWALLNSHFDLPGSFGSCGFMDEREMTVATTALAYGFIAAIFAVSLNHGGIYTLSSFQIARVSYAVFLGVFLSKTLNHRYGHLIR